MQRIPFIVWLSLSLIIYLTVPAWADGVDDIHSGIAAYENGNNDVAIRLFTMAINSGELSPGKPVYRLLQPRPGLGK